MGDILNVTLDPGHGGKQRGGGTRHPIDEANFCLEISKLIKEAYANDPNTIISLTREGDITLTQAQRFQASAKANSHLVISIHINAEKIPEDGIPTMKGCLSFCWPSNKNGFAVANSINKNLPAPLRRTKGAIIETVSHQKSKEIYGVESDWLSAARTICGGHKGTTVLVEIGFITWSDDYLALCLEENKTKIVKAFISGIEAFRAIRKENG